MSPNESSDNIIIFAAKEKGFGSVCAFDLDFLSFLYVKGGGIIHLQHNEDIFLTPLIADIEFLCVLPILRPQPLKIHRKLTNRNMIEAQITDVEVY